MELMTIGMEKGIQQGQANLVLLQLTRRFGAPDAPTTDRIRALGPAQLEELAVALLDFTQMDDLHAWLDRNPPADAEEDDPADEG